MIFPHAGYTVHKPDEVFLYCTFIYLGERDREGERETETDS